MFNNISRRNLENIDFLDILSIVSFIAQISNMDENSVRNKYIDGFIKNISYEINKLHQENDIIMEKVDNIISILEDNNKNGINK